MNTSELWIGGKEHKLSSGDYFDDLNPRMLISLPESQKEI